MDVPIIEPRSILNVEKYPFCLPNLPSLLSFVIISPTSAPDKEPIFVEENVDVTKVSIEDEIVIIIIIQKMMMANDGFLWW